METWDATELYKNIVVANLDEIRQSSHPIIKKSAAFLPYINLLCGFLLYKPALLNSEFKLVFAGGSIRALLDGSPLRDVDIYIMGDQTIVDAVQFAFHGLTHSDKLPILQESGMTTSRFQFDLNVYPFKHETYYEPPFKTGDVKRSYNINSFYPDKNGSFKCKLLPFQVINYFLDTKISLSRHFPVRAIDVINNFDLVNCSAGISFSINTANNILQETTPATVVFEEVAEHPFFGLSLAAKELLINTSSDFLPRISLPRLLKYLSYGYKLDVDNKVNLSYLARLMGIPNETIVETIFAGKATSC